MNTSFLISIIIPMYNASDFLKERIKHLLAQDLGKVQLICIDDGSTDDTLEICKELLQDFPNTEIITQKNKGLSEARNTGLQVAKGEYVLFLDSDDILLPDGLAEIKRLLTQRKPDVLMGKLVIIRQSGREVWPKYSFPQGLNLTATKNYVYRELTDGVWNSVRYICRCQFIYENALFFKAGLICEDMEWTPRMLETAKSIEFVNTPFYGYFHNRPGSITSTYAFKRIIDVNKIVHEGVLKYQNKAYGKYLAKRLLTESFYGLNRYYLCNKEERKDLVPSIKKVAEVYKYSDSFVIRICGDSIGTVPIYLWSVLLSAARKIRKLVHS